MDILLIMLVGALLGHAMAPAALKRPCELVQVACTALLIFTMGVSLGTNDDLFAQLATLGYQSLLFCLLPTALSVAVVYLATSWLMGDGKDSAGTAGRAAAKDRSRGLHRRIMAFLHEESMVIIAFVALVAGVAAGIVAGETAALRAVLAASDVVLDVLMFLVGVSVGMRRGIVASIREHHVKTLVIPVGVIVGSIVGGAAAALMLGYEARAGMAVASGLGWYSLAGVTIEGLAGAQLGAIAFLASLMRELLSFFSIPLIARHLNYYACIAAAAATSEDTTLPMMIRYTDERTVVFSLVNGIICSTFVPVLISLFLG